MKRLAVSILCLFGFIPFTDMGISRAQLNIEEYLKTPKAQALMTADDLRADGKIEEAWHYYSLAYPYMSEDEKHVIGLVIKDDLDDHFSFRELENIYKRMPKDRFPIGYLSFKLARFYCHMRKHQTCQDMLAKMTTSFPNHELADEARAMLHKLERRSVVKPRTIGVILPLSGRGGYWGRKAFRGIEFALRKSDGEKIRVIIRDSAHDPKKAAKAVQDLVEIHKVIAIIGPLMSNTARSAAIKAEDLSVPIITLSRAKDLPSIGQFVFRHSLTDELTARAIAEYSVKTLGYKRFAILYPDDRSGLRSKDAFWDAVIKLGAEITACEAYPYDATTFRDPIEKLVGRHYYKARPEYWQFLTDIKDKYKDKPTRRRQAIEKFLHKELRPIVDFDAIFIPDSYRKVSLIAPALAFEDIELEDDNKWRKGKLQGMYEKLGWPLKQVRLLGAEGWHSSKLIERCSQPNRNFCRGGIFANGWDTSGDNPYMQRFSLPKSIKALGFDTVQMLRKVLDEYRPTDRQSLRNALLNMRPYQGLTGMTSFAPNGEVNKKLTLFKVGKKEIHAIDE